MGPTKQQVYDDRSVNVLVSTLVSSDIVDRYDMKWAERESERKDRPLLDILVELELVTPLQLQSCMDALRRVGRIQT